MRGRDGFALGFVAGELGVRRILGMIKRALWACVLAVILFKVWFESQPWWTQALIVAAVAASLLLWITGGRVPHLPHRVAVVEQPKRQPLDPDLRRAIIARDDGICGICGFRVTDPADIHIDHIHPVHAGGDDDPENLQTAHADCNLRKGGVVGWQPPYRRAL